MADPLTIIGAIGAIGGIIDVSCKAINGLKELQGRWKGADLDLLSFISQITVLQAALRRFNDWMNDDDDDQDHHHQLIIDLGASLSCCRMLFKEMVLLTEELSPGACDDLDLEKKIKVVLSDKKRKTYQGTLNSQIGSLNFYLSVGQCVTRSEQQKLLEKSRNRKNLVKLKQETVSLNGQYDTGSVHTQVSDALSNISQEFSFDFELLGSHIYRDTLRSLSKRIKKESPITKSATDVSARSTVALMIEEALVPAETASLSLDSQPVDPQQRAGISTTPLTSQGLPEKVWHQQRRSILRQKARAMVDIGVSGTMSASGLNYMSAQVGIAAHDYKRSSDSLADLEELMIERGLKPRSRDRLTSFLVGSAEKLALSVVTLGHSNMLRTDGQFGYDLANLNNGIVGHLSRDVLYNSSAVSVQELFGGLTDTELVGCAAAVTEYATSNKVGAVVSNLRSDTGTKNVACNSDDGNESDRSVGSSDNSIVTQR